MSEPGEPIRVAHLRLLGAAVASGDPSPPGVDLVATVRTARRDMARLLRAMQACGRGVSTWPDEVLTRLAHVDAVTARFLIDPQGNPEPVHEGADAMRALERWILASLTARELAEVRAFELMIRIADEELDLPLLCPDGSPEEQSPAIGLTPSAPSPRSLRAGLRGLADDELAVVVRRLGLRPLDVEGPDREPLPERESMELAVLQTLRDDHLLSILVATLQRTAHELLAALVRGKVPDHELRSLDLDAAMSTTATGETLPSRAPATQLRACGLLFRSGPDPSGYLWVPVELQHRLDGTLRTFGL